MNTFAKNGQYVKFCAYGFLKNLRFFDAFLLLFFLENGISYTQIGVIYAVREMVVNFSEIPSGILADSYGRKNSLIAAFASYIISFFIFYFSDNFYTFLIAIILYGIGDAFRSGTHKGMIMDYLKLNNWQDQNVAYYGQTRSWSQKGSAISALFAGILVLYTGDYQSIFLYSVVPYLLNFLNIYSYPNELNFSSSSKKRKQAKAKGLLFTFKSFIEVIREPKVFQLIHSAALHTSFLKAVKDYIQPVMVHVALLIPLLMDIDTKRKSGIVIGVIYFFIFLLTSYASKNAAKVATLKWKNLSRLTLVVGLIAGASCGLLYRFEYWLLSLLAFVVIYVLENLRKPLLTGAIADQVPNEILTSVFSAQSFWGTILTSLLALSLGILADSVGIGLAFVLISVFLLMGVGLIAVLDKGKQGKL
ncbi:MAG: MFS transporter [Chitinophagales bacterium]